MVRNPAVDAYIRESESWQEALGRLREIATDCGLIEELKWGVPCYTFEGGNVALLGQLKEACVFSFLQGALLKDPAHILAKPGENTRASRLIRFTHVSEIDALEPVLRAYIHEAMAVKAAGERFDFTEGAALDLPAELQDQMDADPALRDAFLALTPGRQRGYILYFAAAKQSKTRTARIEKSMPRILDGKGLNDCICGRTQKPPGCDGSHKHAR